MLRHSIPLSGQRSRQFCHQFLACILSRAKGSGLNAVQLPLRTRGVSHLVEKVRVERLPILELPFLRHHNLVLADGEIGGITKHGFDGTYPTVVRYHPINGFKGKLLVLLHLGHRVFLFQFLPKLWSDLLQVGLRHIEDMVSLKFWIYIILFALLLRKQFVVLPLDVLFCFLIDHSKRGEHHGERMLPLQYRHTRLLFLVFLAGLVKQLNAVEGAEARNLVAFLLAMQEQHHSVHAIIFSSVQVFRPLQRALGKPWLFPSVFARQRLNTLNHHIGKQVECLVFGTRTFLSIRLSHNH